MSEDRFDAPADALGEALYQGDAAGFASAFDGQELSARWGLAEASGVTDLALLDRLAGLGIRAETLAALTLVPLIEVAWADGHMDPKERDAILDAARQTGLDEEAPSYRLLRIWTHDRPAPALASAWSDFVQAVGSELAAEERVRFEARILGHARAVAEAARGILGLGPRVSKSEEAVLERLASSFGP